MDGKCSVLNRFFTQTSFKETLNNHVTGGEHKTYSAIIKRCLVDPQSKSNGEIISEIYQYIDENYRNEYFYKNTLLNKLLLGVHKPTTTTALTEVAIGSSKADFIMINGRAVVYEIKTALDSFERLRTQISDYYKAFDNVVVLTDEKNCGTISKLLKSTPVGIFLLTHKNHIHKEKEPESFMDNLDPAIMFKILNKYEYEDLLRHKYGVLPDTTAVKYYRECLNLFCKIDIKESYVLFKNLLKKRNKILMEEYSHIPYSLKSVVYFSKFRKEDYQELELFLREIYKGGR